MQSLLKLQNNGLRTSKNQKHNEESLEVRGLEEEYLGLERHVIAKNISWLLTMVN